MELLALMPANEVQQYQNAPNIYCILIGEQATDCGLVLAEQIRQSVPNLKVITHLSGGGLKNQLK